MKKIFVLSAIAAMVLASCTTKETIETPVNNPVEKGKVTLKATMPSFESTKASVDASGNFAWASGDKIDVVYTKAGSPDKTYEFTYNGTDFEYVGTIEEGYAVSAAYYPVGYAGTASTQNFASLEDAAKGFQMTATVNAGVLEFAHDNAMLHVTVNNVPSFAKALTVGGSTITLSSPATSIEAFVPVAPAASAKLSIALSDGTNDIISKSSKNAAAIAAAKMYPLNDLTVGPVVDIKKFATSWDKAYIYLFDSDYLETPWADLGNVVKSYNDGEYDHYYRVLPAEALNKTYSIIVFNSADDTYRIRTTITIENQNYYSASQKEGLRKVGDTSYRFILRDEVLGTDKDSNPDTYLYIKSIDGVDGSAFTGAWESDGTKALGWFLGKRGGNASGRYYYFDIDALKAYNGSNFVYEYTMYKEGDHSEQWRGVYNVYYNSGISSYIHVGYWSNSGGSGTYIDSDFDSDMSE